MTPPLNEVGLYRPAETDTVGDVSLPTRGGFVIDQVHLGIADSDGAERERRR